jgi:nitrogenase-associated protein
MPTVKFWWQPGCSSNTRQIAILRETGSEVEVRDLLTEPWTPIKLFGFFAGRPVADWFEPSAPAVRNGSLDPFAFSASEALDRLVAEPALIRRPLMEVAGARRSGFDSGWLAAHNVSLPSGPVPEVNRPGYALNAGYYFSSPAFAGSF